jgi:hypothetical protein
MTERQCPVCGRELIPLGIEPSFGLCQNPACRKIAWVSEAYPHQYTYLLTAETYADRLAAERDQYKLEGEELRAEVAKLVEHERVLAARVGVENETY